MSDLDLHHTRFGAIRFGVLWPEGSASMPDWGFEAHTTTRHVPGSNRNVTQTLGKGPQTVTHRLCFETVADFRAFKERVLETDTLVLYAAMTSAPDEHVDLHGEGYVEIADVLLLDLDRRPQVFPDGTVEADATFQRPSP
jgi:hypothetical protein